MIDLKNSLDIVLALITLAAIIYRISYIESAIYKEIDRVADDINKHLHKMQIDAAIHKSDYAIRKEWQDYVARDLKNMIKNKFSRLNFHIIDVQRHLEKNNGFTIRSQPVADPDDDKDG